MLHIEWASHNPQWEDVIHTKGMLIPHYITSKQIEELGNLLKKSHF